MDACPIESTKRSRFGQTGSAGSKRRNRCQRQYATGAKAMGVPGCPELAACTPSIESVRMVLMLVCSIVCSARELGDTTVVLMKNQESFRAGLGQLVFPREIGNGSPLGQRPSHAILRRPAELYIA